MTLAQLQSSAIGKLQRVFLKKDYVLRSFVFLRFLKGIEKRYKNDTNISE